MSEKVLRLKIDSIEEYLSLFDGVFQLTETEKEVLAQFIRIHRTLISSGLDVNPFSTDMKKRVAEELGRDNFNTLNNYIKSMKDKRAILPVDDGYSINPILVPKENESRIIINIE